MQVDFERLRITTDYRNPFTGHVLMVCLKERNKSEKEQKETKRKESTKREKEMREREEETKK